MLSDIRTHPHTHSYTLTPSHKHTLQPSQTFTHAHTNTQCDSKMNHHTQSLINTNYPTQKYSHTYTYSAIQKLINILMTLKTNLHKIH